jgi:hypothetical protein
LLAATRSVKRADAGADLSASRADGTRRRADRSSRTLAGVSATTDFAGAPMMASRETMEVISLWLEGAGELTAVAGRGV